MGITLYDISVPVFQQVLASLRGVLEKGRAHAEAEGLDPESLVEARLIDDMFSLSLQVQRVAKHSQGALRELSAGAWSVPGPDESLNYAGLQQRTVEAEAAVADWTRESVNALAGEEVAFEVGGYKTSYTAEAYVLSFTLPNLYFHATTAYDILRAQGVPIGKRDFLGVLRTTLD